MRKQKESPLVRLIMCRPSILFHLKKMGMINEVIARLGVAVDQDDVDFLQTLEEQGDSDIFQGTYRDMTIQIDAATGSISQSIQKKAAVKRAVGA